MAVATRRLQRECLRLEENPHDLVLFVMIKRSSLDPGCSDVELLIGDNPSGSGASEASGDRLKAGVGTPRRSRVQRCRR